MAACKPSVSHDFLSCPAVTSPSPRLASCTAPRLICQSACGRAAQTCRPPCGTVRADLDSDAGPLPSQYPAWSSAASAQRLDWRCASTIQGAGVSLKGRPDVWCSTIPAHCRHSEHGHDAGRSHVSSESGAPGGDDAHRGRKSVTNGVPRCRHLQQQHDQQRVADLTALLVHRCCAGYAVCLRTRSCAQGKWLDPLRVQ